MADSRSVTDCVNLKSLFIDCSTGQFAYASEPKDVAAQIFREGITFFRAFGIANGRRDSGVDVLEMNEYHFKERDNEQERTTFSPKRYEEFESELRSLLKNH
jgi:hypothetical protein